MNNKEIVAQCHKLLQAYKSGELGECIMPEDSNPINFDNEESRLAYFTLPMAINYQRDSYKLWKAALETYKDEDTKKVFDIAFVSKINNEELRALLLKHKLALQPNNHIRIWKNLAQTVFNNWKSIRGLLEFAGYDFLKLKEIIQKQYKKDFPYFSGPKIFNYWAFIIQEYGHVKLKNSQFISIAPDTHVIQSSVVLGVLTKDQATKLNNDKIAEIWKSILQDSQINPVELHPPFWFWSRKGFEYKLT